MPYITREDGERFIIPSYRDTLVVKKESLLKREILLLCSNYGDYITLQKKSVGHYEVAFSPDPGYLLGECIWQHFNRPDDMIYCEAIPNTSEAILVIVKSGTVYLDGSFSIESIPDELVVFKTQKNNFDIYIHGDVPISQELDEFKFSFDATSVKSFTVLPEPVFPTLEGVKDFQLQLVDAVLTAQGIGVVPTKKIVTVLGVLVAAYFIYDYISTHKPPPAAAVTVAPANPFQSYNQALTTPSPKEHLYAIVDKFNSLLAIPGWVTTGVQYDPTPQGGTMSATVKSIGGRMDVLSAWAKKYNWDVALNEGGIKATTTISLDPRPLPSTISSLQDVYFTMIDRFSYILPGSALRFGTMSDLASYKSAEVNLNFDNASPQMLLTIANALQGLPLAVTKVKLTVNGAIIEGIINMQALGN